MVLVILAQPEYGGSRDCHCSPSTTAPERSRHTWGVRRPCRGADRGGAATWAAAAASDRGGRDLRRAGRSRALRDAWTERAVPDGVRGALRSVEPCRPSGELEDRLH